MLACARHRRRALGGLRRVRARGAGRPHRRRPAHGRASPRPAASSRPGSSSTSRWSTQALGARRRTSRDASWSCSGPQADGGARRRATSTGTTVDAPGRRRPRPGASRSRPPTRSTSSTPPARPASRRASCATTAATRSRWPGRCRNVYDVARRARCGGPPPTSGWVVGHSYIVYAPLLARRHDRALRGQAGRHARRRRVLAGRSREHGVEALFTAPTAIRAIKKEDPDGALARAATTSRALRHPVPRRGAARPRHLRTGPPDVLGVPVVDNWWQTETGWPIAANLRGLEPMPIKAGLAVACRCPGTTSQVLGGDGEPVPRRRPRARSASGCRCRRARCPRCGATTSASSPSYLSAFAGYYLTGDGGYIDEDGYLYVMGRTDDVINVAGHRLSTGSMEAVLAAHPAVAECAVIGVARRAQGPGARAGSWCSRRGWTPTREELQAELVALVRDEIGAVAAFTESTSCPRCRRPARARSCARPCARSPTARTPRSRRTIEDAAVLDALTPVLRAP